MEKSRIATWLGIFFLIIIFSTLNAQETNDFQIMISTYTFDPLEGMPEMEDRLKVRTTSSDSMYQLIQFQRSLTRQEMEFLKKEYGLRLDQYIPNFTYLEYVSESQMNRIKKLPYFRWSGNYEPGYKISQDFGKRSSTDSDDPRLKEKFVQIHPQANIQEVESLLKDLGVEVLQTWDNKKLHLKRIKIRLEDLNLLPDVVAIPGIKWIDEFGQIDLRNQTATWIIQTNVNNSRTIYDRNLRGEGEIIGHIDGPLDINHCFFQDAFDNTPGPGHRKVVAYHRSGGIPSTFNDHGTHTAGTVVGQDLITAGTIPSQRSGEDGHAYRSRISHTDLADINGSGTNASNLLAAFEDMYSDGARVFTNSWGDDGTTAYTTWCADIDQFAWDHDDILIVHAATNLTNLRTPENAKNCLTVAQSGDTPNQNNSDGGNGPTADNRRKPEITAPGLNITSANGNTNCGVRTTGGTSMATPAVAGYAALTRQYFKEGWYPLGIKQPSNGFVPSGALLKATLINSTVDMTGTDETGANLTGYPNNMEGWGRLLMENALYFQGDAQNLTVWDISHAGGLNTGEVQTYFVDVSTNGVPLKISLAWIEPPAAVNATNASINDLDIIVTGPTGIVYRGNDFTNGQSTVNGTTSDVVNNVEMALVNTPLAGRYAIQVSGQQINQGKPSQGYAMVATGDFIDPPIPTGTQNTLVVLTELPGTTPSGAPSQPNAQNLINGVNAFINEASYGQTTIDPVYASVSLTNTLGTYLSLDSNPLIEMSQDVVADLIAGNPNIFDQGTADTNDDIDRIMILLNDQGFTGDWATTGPWPYELPTGLTERISVSVSSVYNDPEKRLNHAMAHQLGMVDLYNHPGVVFAQPHVDNWDIMGNLNIVQPMAWSKERALWLSTDDANSIRYIPRPSTGSTFSDNIPLNWLSDTNTANPRAIAIGLTPNAATLAGEDVFYFIEARTASIGTTDAQIPEEGVLLYYVNEDIQQGEGPVRIIDQGLTTLNNLDDAAFDIGSIPPPAGTGLEIDVLAPTGSEAKRIQIDYNPPATTNDMNIRVGNPHWTSPDIWVDSQEDGFDVENGRTLEDRGNIPIADEDNRIYFTVSNPGPGEAFDVTVAVRISEPYHTIGGEPDFNRFVNQKFYDRIEDGESITDYVVWRPDGEDDPHNCIKVEIQEVFNDINDFNNKAQQNVQVEESATASPYEPVTYQFSVTNPYDYYQLFYFRLEGLPEGWTYSFLEGKKRLSANERYEGSLTVRPPDDAKVCTDHTILVTSWMPKGNTLVQYGGATLQVNLRNKTTLTAETRLVRCNNDVNFAQGNGGQFVTTGYSRAQKPKCFQMVTQGCTDPVRANEEIVLRYEDPDGNPVYRVVTTDQFGCYSDTYVVTEGGEWKASATYKGDDCSGGSSTPRQPIVVPIPENPSPGGITGLFGRNWWFSAHVGSASPLCALNDIADANIYAALDLATPINDNLNLSLTLGLAQMTAETSALLEHPRYFHFSGNIEWNFSSSTAMKPYIRFGPGYYLDKNNNNFLGANFGIGGKSRINDNLIITPGLDYHYLGIGQDNSTSFLSFHLGIIFK